MYVLPPALAPMASYRQFILVRLVPRVGAPGKSDKFPVWPHDTPTTMTLKDGSTVPVYKYGNFNAHDSSCWLDWQTAAALAASGPPGCGWCVGFVITAADPFGCLDIDSCATLAGTWNDDAQMLLRRLPGAGELSQSGQGLHDWFYYTGPAPAHGKRNAHLHAELYTEARFIALGTQAAGTMYDVTSLLPAFCAEFFPPSASTDEDASWTTESVPEHTVLTDDELIHKAISRSRPQGPEVIFGGGVVKPSFSDLWTRNVAVLARAFPPQMVGKDIDASSADMALAKELAYWTGKNCERIRSLMERSALAREKWTDHRSYLRYTVMRGVGFCTAVYHEKPIVAAAPAVSGKKLAPRAIEHQTFIGREELATLFNGCVYIQDNNAMLLPNGDIVDQARFNVRYSGYIFSMNNRNEKPSRSAWEAFTQNQLIAFPRADGTEFNPRHDFQDVTERGGRTWVNVYKKPDVDRRPGDCGPFMTLLHKLFPRDDDALILLSYMAAIVQNPGVKFRWAPFIQGTRGNGKSTIVECLKHALGNKYVFTLKAGMIENGFNSWLENNVLYVADDIYSTRDRTDMMEALKSLITGRDHAITLKGIDSIQKAICGNFMFMDNHQDAMKKQEDTRDLCVLYCAQQTKADRMRDGLTNAYFTKTFYPWLESGGFAFVAEMLHTMEIDPRYNPAGDCQEAPETSSTREAVRSGRTGLEAEIAEAIEMAEPGFAGNFVSYTMLKRKFGDDHKRSLGPQKTKEMMMRLGYELHRNLPDGRTPQYVRPDNYRPQLFVKCDTPEAYSPDPATAYTAAQDAALTMQTARLMGGTP